MKKEYFAHSLEGKNPAEWQRLDVHLKNVANLAKQFAESFGSGDWAYLAGLWHDIGKFLPEWQEYIHQQKSSRPNHSTVGAILSFKQYKQHPLARVLGYIIAGHHAGLPDWLPDAAGGDLVSRLYENSLDRKLNTNELDKVKKELLTEPYINVPIAKISPLNIKTSEDMARKQEHFHLWIRMLFSCLKDADCLDTENFVKPDKSALRGNDISIGDLKKQFDGFMDKKRNLSTPINKQRDDILNICRKKAQLPSGFFSLTVPTGGGKTLSSMAFALEHAFKYRKSRIIMAIPYTSIIEQTAKVYKYGTDYEEEIKKAIENNNMLFGEDVVLEHHSNIDPDKENDKSKLASENWDAPIIVTTNVQLFESLFASRTSSCRKLHNIINSVIILDEAQMLPPEYLKPILSVLRGLVEHFGVTVLICTATQPVLCGKIGSGQSVFEGLSNVIEIVDNSERYVKAFKRVEIVLPNLDVCMEWEDVAKQLIQYEQVLCVVNMRQDCRILHSLMPQDTIHLSANMCGEERSETISLIKQKLKKSEPVRVISTQLVEAGVDIDFPVVYRALAGLDSIAQAAGRCNREGTLNAKGQMGKFVIFQPPKPSPVGLLRKGEDSAKTILRSNTLQELQPSLFMEYFKQFYASVNDFDKPKFQERLVQESNDFKFQFRTFAQEFQLINNIAQQSIIVWYKGKEINSVDLIEDLRKKGPERWIIRRLQRFIVNIPISLFYKLRDGDYIEEIHGYWVQKSTGLYKSGKGLLADSSKWDTELFIMS